MKSLSIRLVIILLISQAWCMTGFSQISSSACDLQIGQDVTYTVSDLSGPTEEVFFTYMNWTIIQGSAQFTSSNDQQTCTVKWNSLPGRIAFTIDYYGRVYDEFDSWTVGIIHTKYFEYIVSPSSANSQITTGRNEYYSFEPRLPLFEVSPTNPECMSYKWFRSNSSTGPWELCGTSQSLNPDPLGATTYFYREVTTANGSAFNSNVLQINLLPPITGASCVNFYNQEEQYTAHGLDWYPANGYYEYSTTNWYIWGGSGEIVANDNDVNATIIWFSLPAQLSVTKSYYRYGVDEFGNQISELITSPTQIIQVNPNSTAAPNVIKSATNKTTFVYNQVPDALVESVSSSISGTCAPINYQWVSSTVASGPFNPIIGATSAQYNFTVPLQETTYFKRLIRGANNAESHSNTIRIDVVSSSWENKNYVREHTVKVPNVSNWKTVDQLSVGQKLETTTFLDGLGRPTEKVSRQTATPYNGGLIWGDVVQFYDYDPYGRQQKQYLPYITIGSPGKFKSDPIYSQDQYYNGRYSETNAYNLVTYDNSPLNRVNNIKSPGTNWSAGLGNSIVHDVNDASDDIHLFSIGYNTGDKPIDLGSCAANTLFKTVKTDENNKRVIEYHNTEGQLICKKAELEDNPSASYVGWMCTYYVYDDFGRLRYTFQPEAVKWLNTHGWSFNGTEGQKVLDELCTRYEYDEKGRNILKKEPGATELLTLYDRRDRVIFRQDGNQRAKSTGEWTVNFYDELDRVTLTGLYRTTKSVTDLKTDANNYIYYFPGAGSAPLPSDPDNYLVVPTRNTSVSEYKAGISIVFTEGFSSPDNDQFAAIIDPQMIKYSAAGGNLAINDPVAASDVNDPNKFTALRYTYYDNYSFTGAKSFDGGFNNTQAYTPGNTVEPIVKTNRTYNMVTGTKVRVLGTNTFLASTVYYDEKARSIQVLADNIKSSTDITTSQYHFDGRLLSSETRHSASGTVYSNYSVLTKFTHDVIGRVTGIHKKFGTNNNSREIAAYAYDDLGRLQKKRLDPGYTGTGKSELEALEYSYNLHGTLTGINKDYALKTPGKYDKWGNFFGQLLSYDKQQGIFANRNLDGHIAGILWTTQGDDAQRKYDYTYDYTGRLINAVFNEYIPPSGGTGGLWSNATMNFSVSGRNGKIEYDLNSNITYMLQKGVIPGSQTPVDIDDLHYCYGSCYNTVGNKLIRVEDNSPLVQMGINGKFGDFSDGANGTNDDYVYDDNGNLIKDLNKGIRDLEGTNGIRYNHLDKPEEIKIAGKGIIRLVYDADGRRLQKIFTAEGSSTSKITSYINSFVYQGDELQFINFEEGRIRVTEFVDQSNSFDFLKIDGNMNLPGGKKGSFDFFIRDHLRNVRMIVTEETHVGSNTCTMETLNGRDANEEPVFGQVDANGVPTTNNEVKGRFLVNDIPGQTTTGGGWQNSDIGQYVSRIGNLAGKKVGPNAFLKVMAGDEIIAQTIYYYQNDVQNHTGGASFTSDILISLAQAISGSPVTSGITKSVATNITSQLASSFPFSTFVNPDYNDASGTRPKAYLGVLYFDERFNFIRDGSVTKRVLQSGNGAQPLNSSVTKAPRNGYAIVYVCNESDEMVYFDNLQVTHTRGRIIEENHYYAYGLRIAGISSRKLPDASEVTIQNKDLYNDKELIDEGDLDWYEYGLRNYDPQIGRFTQHDPLAFAFPFLTPYQYAGCEPVANIDLDGAEGAKVISTAKDLINAGMGNVQLGFSRGLWSVAWNSGGVAHAIRFAIGFNEMALPMIAFKGLQAGLGPNNNSNVKKGFIGGSGAPPFWMKEVSRGGAAAEGAGTAGAAAEGAEVATTAEVASAGTLTTGGAVAFFLAPLVLESIANKEIAPQPAPSDDISNTGEPDDVSNLGPGKHSYKVYEIYGYNISKPGLPRETLKYGVADMKYDTYGGAGNRRPDGQLGGIEGERLRAKYPDLVIKQETLAYFYNKPAAHTFEHNMVHEYRKAKIRPDPTDPDFGLAPPEQGLPYGLELR